MNHNQLSYQYNFSETTGDELLATIILFIFPVFYFDMKMYDFFEWIIIELFFYSFIKRYMHLSCTRVNVIITLLIIINFFLV